MTFAETGGVELKMKRSRGIKDAEGEKNWIPLVRLATYFLSKKFMLKTWSREKEGEDAGGGGG